MCGTISFYLRLLISACIFSNGIIIQTQSCLKPYSEETAPATTAQPAATYDDLVAAKPIAAPAAAPRRLMLPSFLTCVYIYSINL